MLRKRFYHIGTSFANPILSDWSEIDKKRNNSDGGIHKLTNMSNGVSK
jgi:hypothetical protein